MALQRFTKEDPTFRVSSDPETKETIIAGMGELQLEVYVERMKREYNCEVATGAPQVAYRETITRPVIDHRYTHKKQTGGSGQYAEIVASLEPFKDEEATYIGESHPHPDNHGSDDDDAPEAEQRRTRQCVARRGQQQLARRHERRT